MTKRRIAVGVLVGCLFSVVAASAQSDNESRIDALMAKWLHSLTAENIADYASCYWPDATVLTYDTKGAPRMLSGIEAIRANQQQWFDATDYAAMNLTYSAPDRFAEHAPEEWVYIYNNIDRYRYLEAFYIEQRSGEYRIVNQLLVSNLLVP